MNLSFWWPNMKPHPIIAVALSVLLVFLPACAARMAQQEIDTYEEQRIAGQQATAAMTLEYLKRDLKCRGAEATFMKLIAQTSDPRLQPLLDYLRHAHQLRKYMEEKRVSVETSLAVVGDLLLPPELPKEIDPFNGCILQLGDKPGASQGGDLFENSVFYWGSRDWQEAEQIQSKIRDKVLPPEKRTPFFRFFYEYTSALLHTLQERADKGEITLLQFIKAANAGRQYIVEQTKRHVAQLNENLVRAKEQDNQTLLTAVAIGLGVVATAALVLNADANYRIANAQTAIANTMQLQALQAQAPIRCNYTLPGRYGTQGYIYCR